MPRKIARRIAESVSGRSMSTLTVAPATANVAEDATQQYTVTGVNEFGTAVAFAAADITWTVSDEDAGTISATGLFTGGATPATYQVRATHARSGVYDESNAVVV